MDDNNPSAYGVALGIPNIEYFAKFLDDYLNLGGKQFPEGHAVGLYLRQTHRTLQRQVIGFCLGVICGLSKQDYTDMRNAIAIETAKKIAKMRDDGDLDIGMYI